jgi:Endoglucanase
MKSRYTFFKGFFISFLSLLLLSCNNSTECNTNTTPVSRNGQLSVQGTYLVNSEKKPIVLRGVSLGWHNWWPRFYNESVIDWLAKDWECDVVRAAIGVEPDGAYISSPNYALKCVMSVADAAIKSGIYVIIDWHSHNIRTNEAKKFFIQMANRYNEYPNVIYEIFNEPLNTATWPEVKAYSEEIIKAIRAIDEKNIILVGTPTWDQDVNLAADNPIKGYENIMYTLHFYAGTHKQDLRNKADYALQKGLPLFVSECAGMEASGDGAIDNTEWNLWLSWMKKNQISWAAWAIADKEETSSMIQTSASSEGNWSNEDLKEWGITVQGYLKKLNE